MRARFAVYAALLMIGIGVAIVSSRNDRPQAIKIRTMVGPPEVTNSSYGYKGAQSYWNSYNKAERIALTGEKSFDKGHFPESESLARKALAVHPQQARAWLLLARACEKQGEQEETLKAYSTLVYSNRNGWGSNITSDLTTRMRYVLALLRSGNWQEAVSVYEMAMQSSAQTNHGHRAVDTRFDPGQPDIRSLTAIAHVVLGTSGPTWGPASTAEQTKHLEAAVRLRPDLPLVQFAYAQMLEKRGDILEAGDAYHKVVTTADVDLKARAQSAYDRIAVSVQAYLSGP